MDDIISQPTRFPLGLYLLTRCRTAASIADCCGKASVIGVSPNDLEWPEDFRRPRIRAIRKRATAADLEGFKRFRKGRRSGQVHTMIRGLPSRFLRGSYGEGSRGSPGTRRV